jgi:hypothetical protein
MHYHMVHHMMNHMVRQVGPRIREGGSTLRYKPNIDNRPVVKYPHTHPGFGVTGYPQMMQSQGFRPEEMEKLNLRHETHGMPSMWHMGVKVLRDEQRPARQTRTGVRGDRSATSRYGESCGNDPAFEVR